jgi:hypothetical protein
MREKRKAIQGFDTEREAQAIRDIFDRKEWASALHIGFIDGNGECSSELIQRGDSRQTIEKNLKRGLRRGFPICHRAIALDEANGIVMLHEPESCDYLPPEFWEKARPGLKQFFRQGDAELFKGLGFEQGYMQ